MSVALRMQLGKSLTELKFFSFDLNGTISTFFPLHGIFRQIITVDTQEIPNPCFL